MQLTVEFLGLSRRLTHTREVTLDPGDQTTFRDLLRMLASQFPALVGPVIVPHTFDIDPSHMLNIDGRHPVGDLDTTPQDGQRLIFMFVEAGG